MRQHDRVTTRSASGSASHFRGDVEVDDEVFAQQLLLLDGQAALPAVQRLRAWVLAAVQVRPGEVAVDVGAGTGEQVLALADLVGPEGRAVGVEPSRRMREEAQRRATTLGRDIDIVAGSAEQLPLETASVDVLRCERVLQHLTDPAAAVVDMARVLRPGGRVVLVDSDWGTLVLHPGPPDVLRHVQDAMLAAAPNTLSGRRLPGLLSAAGLTVDPDVGSSALALVGPALQAWIAHSPAVEDVVAAGTVTSGQLEDVLAGLQVAGERGEAFGSVTMFAVVGRQT